MIDNKKELHLQLLIHLHGSSVLSSILPCWPCHRGFLVNHLSRNRNDVIFDEVLAHILDVYGILVSIGY